MVYPKVKDPLTTERFRIRRCTRCGLAYTETRFSNGDQFYPKNYRAYGPLVTRILGLLYDLRVSRWSRLESGGGSVLEIGCGSGLMLAAFRRRGWRVLGLERNEEAAEIGRRAQGLDISGVPLEKLSATAPFDLIVLFNVLEHIHDPVSLLKECTRRLAQNGRVVVVVPNFASWQARMAGPQWFHLDVPRHLVHYTPETLRDTLERAGLQVTGFRFASPEHDPYGWVESAISIITGRSNILTRFLMGLDPFGPRTLLAFGLAVPLLPMALTAAVVSWIAKRGALMEATAVVSSA